MVTNAIYTVVLLHNVTLKFPNPNPNAWVRGTKPGFPQSHFVNLLFTSGKVCFSLVLVLSRACAWLLMDASLCSCFKTFPMRRMWPWSSSPSAWTTFRTGSQHIWLEKESVWPVSDKRGIAACFGNLTRDSAIQLASGRGRCWEPSIVSCVLTTRVGHRFLL